MNISDLGDKLWNKDTVLTGDDRMKWGKHQGERLADIPDKYFLWLSKQDWIGNWEALSDYIDGLDLLDEDDDK